MNMLIDSLPHSLYINNKEYAIRYDHKTAILYETMMLDNDVAAEEKPILALRLFYPIIPNDWQEALEGIQWFYRCGEEERGTKRKRGRSTQDRIYSFEHDAPYIYSAFLSQYGIDLTEVTLHWWKFRALFQGLNEDCAISKIMGYRGMEISDSMGKEQKDFYRRMKEAYKIPLSRNEQEKQDAIEAALMGDGNLKGLL